MSQRWQLWRQDDNGQKFLMDSFPDVDAAEAQRALFEARGHKQTYWLVDGQKNESSTDGAKGG